MKKNYPWNDYNLQHSNINSLSLSIFLKVSGAFTITIVMGIVVQKTTITERVADLQNTSNIHGQKNMEKPKTYICVFEKSLIQLPF